MTVAADQLDPAATWGDEPPSHWTIAPLWAFVTHNDEVVPDATDPEEMLWYVEISDVVAGKGIVAGSEVAFGEAPSRARRKVRDGDVLVSTVRTYLRAIAPVVAPPANMIVSTGFAVLRPVRIEPQYLGYVVQAENFIAEVISRSNGVSYPAINASDLVRIKITAPPLPEQVAIASFLDSETAKIDALVAEQERLIELLREKRQAVISHAVTKGLNPDAPMKHSGVAWLGEVPAHWEVVKFPRVVKIAEGQVNPEVEPYSSMPLIAPNHVESRTGRLLVIETATVQGAESGKYLCRAGDVIYSKIRPALAKATVTPVDALCSADMYPMSGRGGLSNGFLLYLLISAQFTAWSVMEADRVAMPKVNRESLSRLRVQLPPSEEQRHIVAFLQAETIRVDRLLSHAETAIDLLQERRAALISAAVTGKINVRLAADATEVA